jgi:hypothetical protein
MFQIEKSLMMHLFITNTNIRDLLKQTSGVKELKEKLLQNAKKMNASNKKQEVKIPSRSVQDESNYRENQSQDYELDMKTLEMKLKKASNTTTSHESTSATNEKLSSITNETSSSKKQLIEEVKQIPIYSVKVIKTDPNTGCTNALEIKVNLPLHSSASDAQLDISTSKVMLNSQAYFLSLNLPKNINDEQAIAKFNKKLKTLTITAPCLV